jgi:large subunit ribosomal protein L14e
MGFTRFVECGRVVYINYGPDAGKLAVIVDMVDTRRVFIDGPSTVTGVARQMINTRRIMLTDIVVSDITRTSTEKEIADAWKAQDVTGAWNKTGWAKKLAAKAKRAATSDFDRFKVMIAKKQRSKLIKEKM